MQGENLSCGSDMQEAEKGIHLITKRGSQLRKLLKNRAQVKASKLRNDLYQYLFLKLIGTYLYLLILVAIAQKYK